MSARPGRGGEAGGSGPCPAEATWLTYVDEALDPERVRVVEAHLIDCERCRGTVLALREEARWIGEVLREDARRAGEAEAPATRETRSARRRAPTRGLLLGLPPALAACAAVVTGLGFLLEARLPGGASWLTPASLIGVNQMLFDFVFAVSERAPGLVEFGVATGAMVGGAALVTFVAGALMRKVGAACVAGLLLGLSAGPATPARAAIEVRGGEDAVVHVARDEVVAGTLVAHGEAVRIDGVVEGNLIAFSEQLDVRGRVAGAVFAFAKITEITGEVEGSVITGAEEILHEGRIGGNLVAAADRLNATRDSEVAGDVGVVGDRVQLSGRIGRDVAGYAERIALSGEAARDADLYAEKLVVESTAVIGGRLLAGTDEETAEIDEGARIAGGTQFGSLEHDELHGWSRYGEPAFYAWLVLRVTAAFLVGLCLHVLVPGLFRGAVPEGSDFLWSMGRGFALLLLTPAAVALLVASLIGIPLAVILTAVYVCAIYLSGIVVAVLVGRHITSPEGDALREFGLALIVGLGVLAVASIVPGLGVLVRIVTLLAGLGLLLERGQRAWRAGRGGDGGALASGVA